jgi:hypothetical protein
VLLVLYLQHGGRPSPPATGRLASACHVIHLVLAAVGLALWIYYALTDTATLVLVALNRAGAFG